MRNAVTSFLMIFLSSMSFACEKYEQEEMKDIPLGETYENINDEIGKNTIVIAQWNIGHFAHGASSNSTIKSSDFEKQVIAYKNLINYVDADIFSVNEYSNIFASDISGFKHKADEAIFPDYGYKKIGHQSRYSCNALFSQIPFYSDSEKEYQCNQTAQITHTTAIKAADYYYMECTMNLNGRQTKLITTHLAFDNNNNEVACNQILELIEKYQSAEYVILCGDWNINDINYFDYFKDAGYKLANHGNFGDYITWGTKVLDNIIVKGFDIIDVRLIDSDLSDHKPIVATISICHGTGVKESTRNYINNKTYSISGIEYARLQPSNTGVFVKDGIKVLR